MRTELKTINLSLSSRVLKRSFDLVLSLVGLILFGWLIMLAWVVMSISTRQNGFFLQERIGRYGKPFRVIKIRSMVKSDSDSTTVTTKNDTRITKYGSLMRGLKIDELPQLINVLTGKMSIVGPRPDVPGFADLLTGRDASILNLRPGITGVASLAFKNEEVLLSNQKNPESYNSQYIYPEKTRLNIKYIENYSFLKDLGYTLETITGIVFIKNDGR